MSAPRRQLLAYRFSAGTRFGGRLVGALERIEKSLGDAWLRLNVDRSPGGGYHRSSDGPAVHAL